MVTPTTITTNALNNNGWIDLGTYNGTGLISWGSSGTTSGTIYTTTTNTISFTPTYYEPLTNNYYSYNTAPPVEETDEAREERLQRQEARRTELERAREAAARAHQEQMAERRRAEERAEELLLSFLNEEQRQTRREHGYFDIEGSHGGRYRIQNGYSGNVIWMQEEGVIGGRFCAHPDMRDGLPVPDAMLAQMLHLTTDEADFIRISNLQHGRRPTHLAEVAA